MLSILYGWAFANVIVFLIKPLNKQLLNSIVEIKKSTILSNTEAILYAITHQGMWMLNISENSYSYIVVRYSIVNRRMKFMHFLFPSLSLRNYGVPNRKTTLDLLCHDIHNMFVTFWLLPSSLLIVIFRRSELKRLLDNET